MCVVTPNLYGPEQLDALRAVFDDVLSVIGDKYVMSRDDLAKLIIALAADGGATDRDEIDISQMSEEAVATIARLSQRNIWPRDALLNEFSSWNERDKWLAA
jgi:hypothetical protein